MPHWKERLAERVAPSEFRLPFNNAELCVMFVALLVVTDGDEGSGDVGWAVWPGLSSGLEPQADKTMTAKTVNANKSEGAFFIFSPDMEHF